MNRKDVLFGVTGSLLLVFIYLATVYLSNLNDPDSVVKSFSEIWYWVIFLAGLFGLQLALHSYIRRFRTGGTVGVAANGVISTSAMIACCAHNLVGLLPVLGLSAAALFIVRFQIPFILIGLFSNLIGLTVILSTIRKYQLFTSGSAMERISELGWKNIRKIVLISGLVITTAVSIPAFQSENATEEQSPMLLATWETMKDYRNSVEVIVTPSVIEIGSSVAFRIAFSTHTVDLDFEATEIAGLIDNMGREYSLMSWQGDPPGGHHREISLEFAAPMSDSTSLTLTLRNINQVDRVFEWQLVP